jgi:sec-independent protein translocase protein TatA
MGSFSLAHWLVVIVVLLLIFGPKRLSEVGKGLGQGIRNFKKGMEGDDGARHDAEDDRDEERPKRLKGASKSERSPKRLEAPREDDDERDRDEDEEDEEELVRPRKKPRRA